MQRRFCTAAGRYRRDGRRHLPGTAAHLWPFARALVATLDLAGVTPDLIEGFDADAAIGQRLRTLERYWDPSSEPPAYASDVPGTPFGGDLYYDDNAWVGLALIGLERMRPGRGRLDRAAQLFAFAAAGWDDNPDSPHPGGVFWVQQGRGTGRKNHDRNTVSNAPNAQLGLHLAELGALTSTAPRRPGAQDMYDWVNATLDAGRDRNRPGTGLFWDKLRGDGTVDRALWSYNQGSMIGVNVLLARRGGDEAPGYLERAEAIAANALAHYAETGFERQPAAFNAIFFRNLLLLHSETSDPRLRGEILDALRAYVDGAWAQRRDDSDRFHFPAGGGAGGGGGGTLLDQSAMVQLLALLAWDPAAYRNLA
jgi:hypothetical protein